MLPEITEFFTVMVLGLTKSIVIRFQVVLCLKAFFFFPGMFYIFSTFETEYCRIFKEMKAIEIGSWN